MIGLVLLDIYMIHLRVGCVSVWWFSLTSSIQILIRSIRSPPRIQAHTATGTKPTSSALRSMLGVLLLLNIYASRVAAFWASHYNSRSWARARPPKLITGLCAGPAPCRTVP